MIQNVIRFFGTESSQGGRDALVKVWAKQDEGRESFQDGHDIIEKEECNATVRFGDGLSANCAKVSNSFFL